MTILTNVKTEVDISSRVTSQRPAYSPLYRLGLTYLGVSILFEFLSQLLFLRLFGFNVILEVMLLVRLSVDLFFIGAGLYYGISVGVFRGYAINTLSILILYGSVIGIIVGNDISEIAKDFILFGGFILKFAIFKAIFLSTNDMGRFFARLQKYCWYTFYIAICSLVILYALKGLDFSFYQQGISNVEWFVAYSAATNRPIWAVLGFAIAFLLAKRMVLFSCVVIFFPYIANRFIRANRKVLFSVSAAVIVALVMMPFVTIDPEMFNYSIRLDFDSALNTFQNFSMEEIHLFLTIVDTPRYLESWSALQELGSFGFWFGGGFGFSYFDTYRGETVSNAHFSPVGFITKFGFFGTLVFYYIFLVGAISGIRAPHQMSVLCGYYVLATVAASLMAWKFFASSPLLPMALAAALYCRNTPTQRAAKYS